MLIMNPDFIANPNEYDQKHTSFLFGSKKKKALKKVLQVDANPVSTTQIPAPVVPEPVVIDGNVVETPIPRPIAPTRKTLKNDKRAVRIDRKAAKNEVIRSRANNKNSIAETRKTALEKGIDLQSGLGKTLGQVAEITKTITGVGTTDSNTPTEIAPRNTPNVPIPDLATPGFNPNANNASVPEYENDEKKKPNYWVIALIGSAIIGLVIYLIKRKK